MKFALTLCVILLIAGIALYAWGDSVVSEATGMVEEGHQVIQEGRLAADWDKVNRGNNTIFVARKSLENAETIEAVGLLLSALSVAGLFVVSLRMVKRSSRIQGNSGTPPP